MRKLAISLLEMNYRNLEKDIKEAEMAGVDAIHIDIMDGNFVPSIGISPKLMKSIRGVTDLMFDVHVMVQDVERFVDIIVDAGADVITIHYEACDNVKQTLRYIKSRGVKCGLAINPDTEICVLDEFMSELDVVHIMTTYPGREGQKFIVKSIDRISELRKKMAEMKVDVDIEVDGNIIPENIELVVKAGATIVVSGRALTQDNMKENIKKMKEKMQLAEKR